MDEHKLTTLEKMLLIIIIVLAFGNILALYANISQANRIGVLEGARSSRISIIQQLNDNIMVQEGIIESYEYGSCVEANSFIEFEPPTNQELADDIDVIKDNVRYLLEGED